MPATFFERLIPSLVPHHARPNSGGSTRQLLVESVRRQLSRLLNTDEGSASACPDYGLPDLRMLSSLVRNDRGGVEELLRQRIQRFEPRLTDVQVRYADPREDAQANRRSAGDDLLYARFRVSGRLIEVRPGGETVISSSVCSLELEQDGKGQVKLDSK